MARDPIALAEKGQFAAQIINRDAHIFTCVDTGETSDSDVARIAETVADVHAGEIETSTSLATRPELVDVTRLKKFVPEFEPAPAASSAVACTKQSAAPRSSSSARVSKPARATVVAGLSASGAGPASIRQERTSVAPFQLI